MHQLFTYRHSFISEIRTRSQPPNTYKIHSDWSMIEISTNHTACNWRLFARNLVWLAGKQFFCYTKNVTILLLHKECYGTVTRIREFFSLARLYNVAASHPWPRGLGCLLATRSKSLSVLNVHRYSYKNSKTHDTTNAFNQCQWIQPASGRGNRCIVYWKKSPVLHLSFLSRQSTRQLR